MSKPTNLCIFFIFQPTWLMIQLLESSFVESATTPPNSQMNITLRKVFNTGGTTTQWDRRSTTGGQSRPPETCLDWTAAPSKVSHTRDANAGLSWQIQTPSQRLKYVRKPGATNTKLRQNPKTVSSKTSFLVEASPVTLEGGHSERNRLSWTLTSPPMICACTCKLTWFCHDFLTPLTSLFISCHSLPLLSMESHSLWLTTSPFCHNFSTLPSFYNFAQVLRQYGSVVVILPVVVIIAIHDTKAQCNNYKT